MKTLLDVLKAFPSVFSVQSAPDDRYKERQIRSFRIPAMETVLGVYDTTVTRVGTRGLLFTDKAMYWNAPGSLRDEIPTKSGRVSYPSLCECRLRFLATSHHLFIEITNLDPSSVWHCFELRPALRGTSVETAFTEVFRSIARRAKERPHHPAPPGSLSNALSQSEYRHSRADAQDLDPIWFGSQHD